MITSLISLKYENQLGYNYLYMERKNLAIGIVVFAGAQFNETGEENTLVETGEENILVETGEENTLVETEEKQGEQFTVGLSESIGVIEKP